MECVLGARTHAKGLFGLNYLVRSSGKLRKWAQCERDKQSGQDHRAYMQGLRLSASSHSLPGHIALTSDTRLCKWLQTVEGVGGDTLGKMPSVSLPQGTSS